MVDRAVRRQGDLRACLRQRQRPAIQKAKDVVAKVVDERPATSGAHGRQGIAPILAKTGTERYERAPHGTPGAPAFERCLTGCSRCRISPRVS